MIFVICVVFVLVTYMLFLMCLDPMLRKQRQSIPYRQQTDEVCKFNIDKLLPSYKVVPLRINVSDRSLMETALLNEASLLTSLMWHLLLAL